ncbi:MAG: SEC10/PgrA surface exclusion domain-containing protein [Lactobacillus sp.]|nr:SEC10/PgrA surface exclusion domain-containing protein [Lactobacillus sp.]
MKGTGVNEAEAVLSEAKKQVNQDIADHDQAVKEKNKKSEEKKNTEKTLGYANEAKETAVKAKTVAESDYQSKKQESDTLRKQANEEQEKISIYDKQLQHLQELSKNTINIGDIDKFKKAFEDYQTSKDKTLTQDDIDFVNEARSKNNFISSKEDNEIVDINNISDDQVKELSLFATDLINKARKQLGWSNDSVSIGSLKVAKDIAKRYIDDNWTGDWHYIKGINEVSKSYGLSYDDSDTNQYYEDASQEGVSISRLTMNDLKMEVYNSLLSMILPDGLGMDEAGGLQKYEMGHTAGLLGADGFSKTLIPDSGYKDAYEEMLTSLQNNSEVGGVSYTIQGVNYEYIINSINGSDNEYLIDDIPVTKDEFLKTINEKIEDSQKGQYCAAIPTNVPDSNCPFWIHFINISPSFINDSDKFSTEEIPSYEEQISSTTNAKIKAEKEFATLDQKAKNAEHITSDALAGLNQADTQLTKAKKVLENANNADSTAQKALDAAINNEEKLQKKLTVDTKDRDAKQSLVTVLTASNEEKTRNLETAKEVQTKAAKEVETAKTALDTAKDNLASAKNAQSDLATDNANKQKAVENAQTELVKLQARQSQLKGAHQALVDAKIATQEAKKDYDTANQAAKDAKTQLDALKPAKDAADAKVKDAQDEYDHAVSKLNDAKAKLDHAKQVLYDLEHPAIYLDDASEVQKPQTQKTVNTSNNEVEKTTPTIKKSTSVKIEFIHNSYVYTLQGKIVKRHGKRYLIRKGHKAVALHNAKIVKINGKKFYQIAKNEYVKVVNTVTASKKVNVKAVVKGKKNHKVRTYSSMGKLSRHYVYGQRTYKFTAKKEIKGRTYYKVSGKNEWVPASKLTLK